MPDLGPDTHRVHRGATRFTLDQALHLVQCGTMNTRYVDGAPVHDGTRWEEIDLAIAQRMVDTDCCLWHASFEVYGEWMTDGRLPTDTCAVCGGRSYAGDGDHALCTARAARGREITRLDVVETRECDCAICTKNRAGRR